MRVYFVLLLLWNLLPSYHLCKCIHTTNDDQYKGNGQKGLLWNNSQFFVKKKCYVVIDAFKKGPGGLKARAV
jgi:hypothetical protein